MLGTKWAAAVAVVLSGTPAGCVSFCLPGACEEGAVLAPPSDVPGGPPARGRPSGPPGLLTDSTEASVTIPGPRLNRTAADSLFDPLRATLRDVADRQQRVRLETGAYTSDLAQLFPAMESPPAPATVTIVSADADGWAGAATRPDLRGMSCVLSVRRQGAVHRVFTEAEKRAGHTAPGTIVCDAPVK